ARADFPVALPARGGQTLLADPRRPPLRSGASGAAAVLAFWTGCGTSPTMRERLLLRHSVRAKRCASAAGRARRGMPEASAQCVVGQRVWKDADLTRVPYWVFQDEQLYAAEQRQLFHGPLWHFLCLAVELANTGDFCTTFVGDTPVLVTRDRDGKLYAF